MKHEKLKGEQNQTLSRSFLILLLSALLAGFGYSQERAVIGTITDESGIALPGVNVIIKGSTTGAVTDINGKYSIKVPGNESVLAISYIGYTNQEMQVADKTTIDFTLKEEVSKLDEVVVVGYGVQKKKLVTGATVQVKSEELSKNNVNRIESALQGLTPGMAIVKQSGQPGSDFNITIRGMGSVNGNNPLVLVDGVPGSLNSVNPSDVESVDVLKDAASAAIYGSRASNGVILVTTKKGKAGNIQIAYDGYMGWSNATNKIPVLDAKQYATIMNEAQLNSGRPKAFFTQGYIDSLGTGTNWQEEAYNKNAPSQSHYLGFTGGNDNSNYSISLSGTTEEGIFDYKGKSKYERLGFRINSEHKVKSFLKIGENLTYTHRYQRALGTGNQYNNFVRDLISASPLISAYDSNQPDGFGRSWANPGKNLSVPNLEQINPIAEMNYKYNEIKNYDDLIGDIYAEFEIVQGLKYRTDFGGTLKYGYNTEYNDTFTMTPSVYNQFPQMKQSANRDFYYNFDNTVTYQKDLGAHNILIMLGSNAQDTWFYKLTGERKGFLTTSEPVLTNVSSDLKLDTATGDFGKSDSRFSYFGRISYNYNEFIMATFSLRRDGSSRFGPNNRIGYFPSVSGGIVLSKLDALANLEWLNFLKLRGSWGQNGKEPADPYVFMATVGDYMRNYAYGIGMSPDKLPNPDLKWEATEMIDFGFDSRFLNSFGFTFDWYRKTSKDWIIQKTVPGLVGLAGINEKQNPYVNGGNVINTGLEFDLNYTKIIGEFALELKGNLAYNKNEVTDVPDSIIHGSTAVLYNGSEEFYRIQEGMPIGFFWGYKTDGIFQTQDEVNTYVGKNGKPIQPSAVPGDVRFVDLNEDGLLNDADKTKIGDPSADFIVGFGIGASYKAWDFSMNVQGQFGNQIVKCYRMEEREYNNYTTDILDRWHWTDLNSNGIVDAGEGTNTRIPRVTRGTEINKNWRNFSDLYIHDGDYMKIKSINIGHDLKKSILKNLPIQQLRIYVAATNLLTLTKYNGMDPEIGYGSYYNDAGKLTDAYASGIDMGFYPSAQTYLVGINVKF